MATKRFIGDLFFESLKEFPGFTEEARKLISSDWRKGTDTFRRYARPMVHEIHGRGVLDSWGEFGFGYIESRFMEGLDPERDPWLWAYKTMTGALVDPATVRAVLRRIEQSA